MRCNELGSSCAYRPKKNGQSGCNSFAMVVFVSWSRKVIMFRLHIIGGEVSFQGSPSKPATTPQTCVELGCTIVTIGKTDSARLEGV